MTSERAVEPLSTAEETTLRSLTVDDWPPDREHFLDRLWATLDAARAATPEPREDGWEELRRLAEAASPGPWAGCAHVAGTDTDCPCRYRGDVVSKATDEVLLQMRVGPDEHPGAPDDDSWKGVKTTDVEQGYANGRYIAAVSPEVVLRLLAAARGEPPEPGLREAAVAIDNTWNIQKNAYDLERFEYRDGLNDFIDKLRALRVALRDKP